MQTIKLVLSDYSMECLLILWLLNCLEINILLVPSRK